MFLIILTLFSIVLGLLFGAFPLISNGSLASMSIAKWKIFLDLRLPRVLVVQ